MSKGLGKIQRSVLEIFELNPDKSIDSISMTGLVFDKTEVSDSELVSVRRALRSLVKAGHLVDMGRGFRQGRRHYATPEYFEQYKKRLKSTFNEDHTVNRPI